MGVPNMCSSPPQSDNFHAFRGPVVTSGNPFGCGPRPHVSPRPPLLARYHGRMGLTDDMVGGLIAAAVLLPIAVVSIVFGGAPVLVWSSAVFIVAAAAGLGVVQSRR
jgi:hypothetical protein